MHIHLTVLDKSHDRQAFDCGQIELNTYLQKVARQHQEKGLSKTWVAVQQSMPATILGYYTLALSEIHLADLNPEDARRLPAAKLPVVRLGRLAVDKHKQGLSIGRCLLVDAIARTQRILDDFSLVAMVVDAKNDAAADYYRQFGFIELKKNPLKLYLPIQTLRQIQL